MVGRFLVPPTMRVGYKANMSSFSEIGDKAAEDLKKVGGKLKDAYDPRQPVFKKDEVEGRNINNLYTGYKLGGKGNIAVTASLLGGGTIYAANPNGINDTIMNNRNTQYQSEELDVESMQSTRGDGQGYKASVGANALSSLSTSGDLVFAMHKTRHSGQF